MSLVYSANQQPTTNAEVWYKLITLLQANGWTRVSDSDGTTYSPSGTQVTGSGSGTNGFNNNNAWVFIRMPSSNRGFVFQNLSSTNVTIRYFGPSSAVTNSPDATNPPASATTNAASQDVVSNVAFVGTLNRAHYWTDNATPYGFGVHGWDTSGIPTFHFILDGMQANTYHPLNQDPYVIIQMPNTSNTNLTFGNWYNSTINSTTNSSIKCWTKHNMSGSGFNVSRVCTMLPGVNADQGLASLMDSTSVGQAVSVYDGKDEEILIQYGIIGGNRSGRNYGQGYLDSCWDNIYQGVSSYLRNYLQYRSGTPFLNTLSVSTTRDRLVIGTTTVPNDGSIPLVP